jgi:hypothetical protein
MDGLLVSFPVSIGLTCTEMTGYDLQRLYSATAVTTNRLALISYRSKAEFLQRSVTLFRFSVLICPQGI